MEAHKEFGQGREVKEMKEDEWEAWEAIRSAVIKLEEEGEWRDTTIRAREITIRKPILSLGVKGGEATRGHSEGLPRMDRGKGEPRE